MAHRREEEGGGGNAWRVEGCCRQHVGGRKRDGVAARAEAGEGAGRGQWHTLQRERGGERESLCPAPVGGEGGDDVGAEGAARGGWVGGGGGSDASRVGQCEQGGDWGDLRFGASYIRSPAQIESGLFYNMSGQNTFVH